MSVGSPQVGQISAMILTTKVFIAIYKIFNVLRIDCWYVFRGEELLFCDISVFDL
jgi:hypothetical protein